MAFLLSVNLLLTPICGLLGADADTMADAVRYLRVIALGAPFIMFNNVFANVIRAVLPRHIVQQIKATDAVAEHGGPGGPGHVPGKNQYEQGVQGDIGDGAGAVGNHGFPGIGMVITMLAMGICMGLQPAISYNFGAGNLKRMKQIIRSTAVFTVCLGSVLTILCYLGRNVIISAFIDNEEVIAYGQVFVFASIIIGPFYGLYQLRRMYEEEGRRGRNRCGDTSDPWGRAGDVSEGRPAMHSSSDERLVSASRQKR